MADVGCGYGPIAIVQALRTPTARIWAVDVNRRAVDLCAANATAAGATNITASSPDDVPSDLRFDIIYSNPPIHVGKEALHDLLARWLDRLASGGTAYLVVHRHLGADSLNDWLVSGGFPTERLRSRQGYRILAVQARTENQQDPSS